MSEALVQMLVKAGSVAAMAEQVGDEAASSALHALEQRTPEEIRGSWPMTIAYARLQSAYSEASNLGRFADAAKIAAEQAKLVKDVY